MIEERRNGVVRNYRKRMIVVGPPKSSFPAEAGNLQHLYDQAREEIPLVKKQLDPFVIDKPLVTKREFFQFINELWAIRGCLPDRDRKFWDYVYAIEGYSDELPILGVSIAEAISYATINGGRLLREEEHQFAMEELLGKCAIANPVVASNPKIAEEVQTREEFIRGIKESKLFSESPYSDLNLCGKVRELVTSTRGFETDPEPSYFWARSTYTAWNDRFFAPGLTIPTTDFYLRGSLRRGTRYWIISPLGFRVVVDK